VGENPLLLLCEVGLGLVGERIIGYCCVSTVRLGLVLWERNPVVLDVRLGLSRRRENHWLLLCEVRPGLVGENHWLLLCEHCEVGLGLVGEKPIGS